jgi:hypothetical protein
MDAPGQMLGLVGNRFTLGTSFTVMITVVVLEQPPEVPVMTYAWLRAGASLAESQAAFRQVTPGAGLPFSSFHSYTNAPVITTNCPLLPAQIVAVLGVAVMVRGSETVTVIFF